nr:hypothetical protein KitaXyl93_46650 [Kitasatospora sp. Xyl93]
MRRSEPPSGAAGSALSRGTALLIRLRRGDTADSLSSWALDRSSLRPAGLPHGHYHGSVRRSGVFAEIHPIIGEIRGSACHWHMTSDTHKGRRRGPQTLRAPEEDQR